MANATFYIISADTPQATESGLMEYILFLCHHFVQQNAKLFINCENKQHAEQLAEIFWDSAPSDFIAHNLVGEGPQYGTNVEIGYDGKTPSWNRQIVINLANTHTTFANQFTEVVDFVSCDEKAKQIARGRFKQYRHAGFQMQTIDIKHP
ncbi:DNA polymerase III subunit chi [Vibrio marisflavi]|uniref:DNA polymerase III subunit chi n=1 Tax=Vibrio marisflavi CECT 7928 TaxID=634439 RepID=A0ABM9A7C8_9VIBR|nr:DNA polymerase III subunit chi [Vibrio marisflavi]CAH0541485.1 DNA polymerase III subunit chi [Vibrio marisflavi CECT 7928]